MCLTLQQSPKYLHTDDSQTKIYKLYKKDQKRNRQTDRHTHTHTHTHTNTKTHKTKNNNLCV